MAEEEKQLAFDFSAPLSNLPQLWTPDDIFKVVSEDVIHQFKEDGRVERKRGEISPRDFADNISMWANTQPSGGVIFVGVDKNGKILGCKHIDTEHINRLKTVRRLCPDARFEFKDVAVKNHKGEDDYVIVARVYYHPDKLVETVDGTAFVREGDEKRKLLDTEKREIRLSKGELDVEMEEAPYLFPTDFNFMLMNMYRQAYIDKRQLKPRYSLEEVLLLSKLGKMVSGRFVPNLACALLFAEDVRKTVPGAFIRVMRYDGVEEQFGRRLNSVADRTFDGPLPTQIAGAINFVEAQIRNFTRLGPDGRFVTSAEYPTDVWIEAIVNAAVHRSYNLRHMNIFVKMFENKFIVESPGAFMPPTTAETVYDTHNPRNPNLMWALYYFDYVQCAFEGTRRMRDEMRRASLPDPKFTQRQVGTFQVSVTLENDHEHRKVFVRSEAAPGINPEVFASLSDTERLIVNYLVDQQKVNVTDATLVIMRDWRETKKILDGLVTKSVVLRSPGKTRSRHRFYYLKNRTT